MPSKHSTKTTVPRDKQPSGSSQKYFQQAKTHEKQRPSKDAPQKDTSAPKTDGSTKSPPKSTAATSKRSALSLDTEQAAEMDRKRRRLEAQMANILQMKKDFDDKMSQYTILTKVATAEEVEVKTTVDAEKSDEDQQLPKTPEPAAEQEDEDLYYYGEEGEYDQMTYQDSTSSEAQDVQWQDFNAENPEEAVETYPSRPSLPDDIGMYNLVVQKAALTYGVKLEEDKQKKCFLLETLLPQQTRSQFLPMLPSVLDQGRDAFEEPAVCRAVTPRTEKYKHSSQDPAYIHGSVPADSIISATARKRANIPSNTGPPPDKKSRRMDLTGRKVEWSAAIQWRIANSNALINRHAFQHWDEMGQLIKHLLEQHQLRATHLVEEGKNMANTCLKSALDAAETASRQMMIGVTERRQAWLRISGIKPEVQNNILNTPFTGDQLFGSPVDEKLAQLKKDNETARSMGALQFRGMRRGTPSRRPGGRGGNVPTTSHQTFHQGYQGNTQGQQKQGQQQQSWQYQPRGNSFRGRRDSGGQARRASHQPSDK